MTHFLQSNFAGQVIVVILIAMSMVAWVLMIGKYIQLKTLRQRNSAFERYFDNLPSVIHLHDPRPFQSHGLFSMLFAEAIRAYHQTDFAGSGGSNVSQSRIGMVENALQRSVAKYTHEYENKMIFLASIVTGAPFLGLLGTVWGVMDAFGAVALQKTATLQMLAPGVSGSLLTTVVALVVAIPSVFGYNYLLSQAKLSITDLENFASVIADRFEREHQLAE